MNFCYFDAEMAQRSNFKFRNGYSKSIHSRQAIIIVLMVAKTLTGNRKRISSGVSCSPQTQEEAAARKSCCNDSQLVQLGSFTISKPDVCSF